MLQFHTANRSDIALGLAGVPESVPVGIALIGVPDAGAVVDRFGHAVAVGIGDDALRAG